MAGPTDSGYIAAGDPTRPRSDAAVPFRDIIPAPDHPKIQGIAESNALDWCDSRRQIPAPAWLIDRLEAKNLERPLKGFTATGEVEKGVWRFADDEGAPVEEMKAAAEKLLAILSPEQKEAVEHESIDVDEIRLWSNPELYMNPGGLRLDDCSEEVQIAVHGLMKASFSPEGYQKVLGCCLTNGFLGHLVHGEKVLNEHSYNFRLFGNPDVKKPWGYSFFGHHLCIALVVQGKRLVIGPTFLGAEPDRIDEGPHKGLRLFRDEELLPLQLMNSLSPELQEKALLCKGMTGDDLPAGRWNPFDERHLGGARQDNRVIPYEGCPVSAFSVEQKALLIELFRAFNSYYPEQVLQYRLQNFLRHINRTYFAWIGSWGDEDPFYYRIHSPVSFMELDFHCGIFLTNTSPARCHIHTVNRLPNRGDYGRALVENI